MNTAELPRHLRLDRQLVENYLRGYPLARLIPSVLHELQRLPQGPCLLVGNHGPLALDTGLLIHAIWRDSGRIVRALGDRMLFSNPVGRQIAKRVGGVEGRPENARALLESGACVLVYPGGARETVRDASQRYRLDWEGRLGFARIALEQQVPVVPVACIGSDDVFRQVVDGETMRSSFAGRLAAQFVKPDYIPPLYLPKLRPIQFHYYFGEPVAPSAADASDEGAVRSHQERVKRVLEGLVERGLAIRREKLARAGKRTPSMEG